MENIYILLILFQFKHFFADYPLQTSYMLGKFQSGLGWILPLLAHVSVHGLFTGLIALCFKPELALELVAIDMVAHFIMDRIKASPNMLGRFKALSASQMQSIKRGPLLAAQHYEFPQMLRGNTLFWWSLGIDQGFHHLTHYYLIWRILS